ncbi:MAG: hypothetical protein ACRD2B_12200 [Terriglobia bacterium]
MRKMNRLTWLAVPALAILLVFPLAGALRGQGRERHPQIYSALRALQNARQHLQHGAHDFGGHRAQALRLTNQAIQECRQALRYDKH